MLIAILLNHPDCPRCHITRLISLICSLHIMLDYFIDQEEDKAEADFNFVSFYKDEEECCWRLVLWQKAKKWSAQILLPQL